MKRLAPPSERFTDVPRVLAITDKADYEAHKHQGGAALHALVAAHLAPWLATLGATTPSAQTGRRALLIGDSHAAGLAAPLRERYRTAGIDLTSRAVNGTTIDQWAGGTELADALSLARPALTLVSLGTNDLATKPAAYKRALVQKIVSKIRAAGSSVGWILPPKMSLEDRGGLRAILRDELARLAVPAFDSEALDLPRGGDGIHATPKGYEQWAAHVATWSTSPPTVQPIPWTQPAPQAWTAPATPQLDAASSARASRDPGGLAPLAAFGVLALLRS